MPQPASGTAVLPVTGNPCEGEKKSINPELWQACAGPLVSLPPAGTHVLYFPQGHSEQVAASMKKDVDGQIPNYPNLPSKLLCLLHNVTLHADPETDEVYAQMTLQPVTAFDKDALLRSDLALKAHKPQTEFFCKTLTASDTSTHGGFSVPRRAAEKIFPPLDFSMQPPAQELAARDLHDNMWTFRHIYRGQPKRHLLTTGWSLFVSGKRLLAGDSVLFIRDEKQQLLLGIRRANKQPTNLSSSVLSSDSMHIGILAAAAHAAANNSPFTVFYNPRTSSSEFVIPLAKYYKAVYSSQVSPGMRFRMMFETEESGTRRYMGTITGISDLDSIRWKNSQWRNLQVGWDESTTGERRNRVSIWEIEPVTAPFFFCPPPFFRHKRPRQPGMPEEEYPDLDNIMKRTVPCIGDEISMKDPQAFPGLSLMQWMAMQQQQNPSFDSMQPNYMSGSVLHSLNGPDNVLRQLTLPPHAFNNSHRPPPQVPVALNQLSSMIQPQQQVITPGDVLRHSMLHRNHNEAHHALARQPHGPPLIHPRPPPSPPPLQVPDFAPANPMSLLVKAKTDQWFGDGVSSRVPFVQSGITEDPPSCSTSPSTNNSVRPCDDTSFLAASGGGGGLEALIGDARPKPRRGPVHPEYLDTSSSVTTSAGFCDLTGPFGFGQQAAMFGVDDVADPPLSSGGVVCGFDQNNVQELSSSVISQPFGVPDIPFESAVNGGGGAWATAAATSPSLPPQASRMRSFTKVYKRGAVGRSIDVSRYSGYDELKHDLARRFGIEGQLEDRQKIGWKLVYVDHEKDVLLLGDDPWEEFVNCVRCIKILSPQEVQQMSIEGDIGSSLIPIQACSSSDGGNV